MLEPVFLSGAVTGLRSGQMKKENHRYFWLRIDVGKQWTDGEGGAVLLNANCKF
jgi:hypothetical protein